MKIVVLDGYTLNPGDLSWAGLEALGELTVYDRTAAEDTVSRIGDAEIVYTNKTALGEKVFAACPSVKFVGVLATGYNIVDTGAAKKRGVPVCNVPTYGTTAVSQFAFALLLEICHHVGHHRARVIDGEWQRRKDYCFWDYPLIELAGKTMGIVGFGRIGRATADIARAFGMQILAFDTYQNPDMIKAGYEYSSFDGLLARSDIVSLHCPLFEDNKGMINKDSIAKMKDGAILLNTSRGPLVNEGDLAQALKSGKLYAAGLDVMSSEPINGDNPLLGCDNCIISPHIAWAPRESRERLMAVAVENLKSFIGGKVINSVGA